MNNPDQPVSTAGVTSPGVPPQASGSPPVVPFVSGPVRIRFDVAAHDITGIEIELKLLIRLIKESPDAPGWATGDSLGNGVADRVTYRTTQHDETGTTLQWPANDPLPRGYSFVENTQLRNASQ